MADGVLNPLDKNKALELIRDFVPTIRRFEAAVAILFDPERLRRLLERKGVTAHEDLESCDEVENMRGLDLRGEHGSLSFVLADPILFLDPKVSEETWEEGLEVPLALGPRLHMCSDLIDEGFFIEIGYDLHRNEWRLQVEWTGQPLVHEHDPQLPDEDNAAYAKAAERLNEQFNRLEIPKDALQLKYKDLPNKTMEYKVVIDESRVRTLVPIFYDICDAYFDFDLG